MGVDSGIQQHENAKYDVKQVLLWERARLERALKSREEYLATHVVGEVKARNVIMATADVKYFKDAIVQIEKVMNSIQESE